MRGLVRTDSNRKDLDFPPVVSASFDMFRGYINNLDCMFVASDAELGIDLMNSGLSYIRAIPEHNRGFFCVMNNYYPTDCFLKLCSYWCRKYHIDGALVTIPEGDNTQSYKLTVRGKRFDRDGAVVNELVNVSLDDVEKSINEMCENEVKLASADIHLTSLQPFQGTAGFVIALNKFKEKYPELAGDKND